MGFLEEIDKMELSDEQKVALRQNYADDTRPARLKEYKADADEFVGLLMKAGMDKAPGVLKHIRRIMMSEDAHEPAAILMSDNDLGLSGADATGASSREEVTLADEVKRLFSMLPGFAEGKLKMEFTGIALADESGAKPDVGDEDSSEAKLATAREELRRVTGVSGDAPTMTRKRYRRGGHVTTPAGGDS